MVNDFCWWKTLMLHRQEWLLMVAAWIGLWENRHCKPLSLSWIVQRWGICTRFFVEGPEIHSNPLLFVYILVFVQNFKLAFNQLLVLVLSTGTSARVTCLFEDVDVDLNHPDLAHDCGLPTPRWFRDRVDDRWSATWCHHFPPRESHCQLHICHCNPLQLSLKINCQLQISPIVITMISPKRWPTIFCVNFNSAWTSQEPLPSFGACPADVFPVPGLRELLDSGFRLATLQRQKGVHGFVLKVEPWRRGGPATCSLWLWWININHQRLIYWLITNNSGW